jgi:hypothetical protein
MGILGKLMFWKKKDEFSDIGLGDKENLAFGNDSGFGNQQQQYPGYEQGQGYGQYPSQNYPAQSSGNADFSMGPSPRFQQQFQPPRFDNPQQDMNSKNLEVISSKLDALRAAIESMNQRLANLEAIARGDEQNKRGRYY